MTSSGVNFEMTINIGNVITILAGIIFWGVSFVVAWVRVGGRLDMFDLRLTNVEKSLITLTAVLEKFASNEKDLALVRQEVAALTRQIATVHETVEKLRVGEGFIQGPRRGNVQGEYPSRAVLDGNR